MSSRPPIRLPFDRLGVALSAACAVHCAAGAVLVGLLGLGGTVLGGALADPRIHEYGLVAAVVIGGLGLGAGAMHHLRPRLLAMGGAGLALMALGLMVDHGPAETALTVCGVTLLAFAHIGNLRHRH